METTIFAMKKYTKEGKPFTVFSGRIHKKDGSELPVTIKFRESCGSPKTENCPCILEFDKAAGNLSTRTYISRTGEEKLAYTLWLSDWKISDKPYEDHSLDEFE